MQQRIFGNARYGLCGFGLLIASYALFFFNPVEIIKSAKLKFVEGSFAYQLWQKPPVKVYVNVYIFNVTNAEKFLSGEDDKMNVEEIGPYVYWEELENTNCTFHSNGTISYTPVRKLHFELKSSIGDPETDRIVVPNIPLLGFSSMLSSMFVASFPFNTLVNLMDSKPILNLSVKEFLWGYDDQLVKAAHRAWPSWINFNRFGILDRMLDEGTNVITMVVPTKKQTKRPYTIEQFNGSPILSQWVNKDDPSEPNNCSLNGAAEGLLFPRHLTSEMNFPIYRKAFCRTLPLTFNSTGRMPDGYPVYLYKFLPEVFNSSLEDNHCYCPNDGCLPSGLSDISPCYYGIPVAVSFPHFYGGNPSLLDNVNGLHPDPEKHQSVVGVQPDLGIPLSVNIKIQLNLVVKANYVSRAKRFNDLTLPVCWLHLEVKSLPASLNALLYLCFNVGPTLVNVAVALMASVGFFMVGLMLKRLGRDRQKQRNQQKQQRPINGDFEYGVKDSYDSDYDDDCAESGGLIPGLTVVMPTGQKGCDGAEKPHLLPLHIVPMSPAAIDYEEFSSSDFARGR